MAQRNSSRNESGFGTSAGLLIFGFGILLPLAALLLEARTQLLANCGFREYGFDPLPTRFHVVAIFCVPLSIALSWIDPKPRRSLLLAAQATIIGFVIGVAAFYVAGSIELIAFSFVLLVVGFGFLTGCPLFAMLAAGAVAFEVCARRTDRALPLKTLVVLGFASGVGSLTIAERRVAHENELWSAACNDSRPSQRAAAIAELQRDPPDFAAIDARWSGLRAYLRGVFASRPFRFGTSNSGWRSASEQAARSRLWDVESASAAGQLEDFSASGESANWSLIDLQKLHFLIHGTPYLRSSNLARYVPGDLHEGYFGYEIDGALDTRTHVLGGRLQGFIDGALGIARLELELRIAANERDARVAIDLPPGAVCTGFTFLQGGSSVERAATITRPTTPPAPSYSGSNDPYYARLSLCAPQRLEFTTRMPGGFDRTLRVAIVAPLQVERESATLEIPAIVASIAVPPSKIEVALNTDTRFLPGDVADLAFIGDPAAMPRVRVAREESAASTPIRAPICDGSGNEVLSTLRPRTLVETIVIVDRSASIAAIDPVLRDVIEPLAGAGLVRVEFTGEPRSTRGWPSPRPGGIDPWPAIMRAMGEANCAPRHVVLVCGPLPCLFGPRATLRDEILLWPEEHDLTIVSCAPGPNALRGVFAPADRVRFALLPDVVAAELSRELERWIAPPDHRDLVLRVPPRQSSDAGDGSIDRAAADAIVQLWVAAEIDRDLRRLLEARRASSFRFDLEEMKWVDAIPIHSRIVERAMCFHLVTECSEAMLLGSAVR